MKLLFLAIGLFCLQSFANGSEQASEKALETLMQNNPIVQGSDEKLSSILARQINSQGPTNRMTFKNKCSSDQSILRCTLVIFDHDLSPSKIDSSIYINYSTDEAGQRLIGRVEAHSAG